MRREIVCRLAGLDTELFKSMSKRAELPFARDEFREVGDYTPNEALMLRVALDLRNATIPRAAIGEEVRKGWMQVWSRAGDVTRAPDLFMAIVTARSDDGQLWSGLEVGTLAEIEALAVPRHERYWNRAEPQKRCADGNRLVVTSLTLANVSQAFRDLRSQAADADVDLQTEFLEFYGA